MKFIACVLFSTALIVAPMLFAQSQQTEVKTRSDAGEVTTTVSPSNFYTGTDWGRLLAFLGVAVMAQAVIGKWYFKPMMRDELDKWSAKFVTLETFQNYKESEERIDQIERRQHARRRGDPQ